ncbi:hypothetical protein BU26DRAFT_249606 [Trematosphaeria pertusa]|uniref:Cellulosomal protein n=1 Tax=Trematosphaeria pertusa TaxID=390896 RepID=A0A6A6IR36_9PLEO|nr:uncharacterized protein BU26DRAFT_249606 [Trematosphaeria pertusa]KAF2252050.1 hypothetical protein BU26DRAFT_249606 [Trematosphaeria pertusa]
MSKQELCDNFYNIDNLVTISLTIPDSDWQALKNAEPRGGRCNFSYTGDRYDWFKATSVTVSGTKFPKQGTFSNIGLIKKSYCGSFSTSKPSLRLDFSKYVKENEDAIEALIGTKVLTLNNSKQDSSYVRQPLGYELFRQAGLPYPRCNFAKVVVNGTTLGVYVNLEPFKKRFYQHNFAGNDKGNAYELEVGEDLDTAVINSGRISFEGLSQYEDMKDIKLAASQIASGGLAAAQQVIDWDQFLRFFAMESLLKHWDGYTQNTNNTYIYNDTVAVANPAVVNVKLKFIPSGIDQIMQEGRDFEIGGKSVLAGLVRSDQFERAKLFKVIRDFANTIFNTENHDKVLTPLIGRMEALLTTAGGVSPAGLSGPIGVVRKQLKLVKSGAYQLIGEMPTESMLLLSKSTGDCIHASNSEFIGSVPTPTSPQEVYHCPPTGALADSWTALPGSHGFTKFKNRAYGTWLHCDANVKTPSGKLNVYAARNDPDTGNEFTVLPTGVQSAEAWHASGYFALKSKVTGQFVYFSETDLTPKGRKEVHQIGTEAGERAMFLF